MTKYRFALVAGAYLAIVSVPSMALAEATPLSTVLNGANETGGGDTDGSGKFAAKVDPEAGDLCYTLSAKNIGAATAAHIHAGAAGSDGKPVVTLEITGDDLDECVAVEPDTLKALIAAPADYYVNVHSAEFPKGAVRGQLAKP